MKPNLQIGVMGSAADLNYAKELEIVAERTGELIAEQGSILFFGARLRKKRSRSPCAKAQNTAPNIYR